MSKLRTLLPAPVALLTSMTAIAVGAAVGVPAALAAQRPAGQQPVASRTPAASAVNAVRAPVAPIPPDDYGKWERLGQATLSHDGSWLAYTISRVNEEEELRIRPVAGASADAQDTTLVIAYGSAAEFSAEDRWLAYAIGVSEEEREQLEEDDEPVHRRLGLLDLTTGDTTLIEGVASFAFSGDGAFLAMHRYPPDAEAQGDSGADDGAGNSNAADLVVRDLASGVNTRFGSVAEFAWQDNGTLLAMVIAAQGAAGKGVQLYDPATGTLQTLDGGEAEYTGLVWRPEHDDLAVLRVQPDSAYQDTAHVILAWRGLSEGPPQTELFDPATAAGFPADTRVVPFRPLRWSEDGATLFFGIKERRLEPQEAEEDSAQATDAAADSAGVGEEEVQPDEQPEPRDEAEDEGEEDDEESPGVLVWHAQDIDIIPRQRVEAEEDRRENYLAAWHLDADRFVQLGNELTEDVTLLDGDRLAVGTDQTPYEQERMFGPVYEDIYVIDVENGERRKVRERVQYFFGGSPGGRYLLYLENDHYWTYNIEADRHTRITEGVPTSFVDLEDDHTVEQKPPFGFAGWTEGDGSVLLYDKYDIWQADPDAAGAVYLTQGAADSIRYRYVDLEREEGFEDDVIRSSAPLYLSVYNEWTEQNGYARAELGEEPEGLVWFDKDVSRLEKAEEAAVYLYAVQDFDDSPDYFVAAPISRKAGRSRTRTRSRVTMRGVAPS